MDYRIWVSYHNDALLSEFGLEEDEHHRLFATHRTPDGENINHLNPIYSEMVTMYYVWKNGIKSKYVGFEHYRRHLRVSRMPGKGECQVYTTIDFGDDTGMKHGGSRCTVYEQYGRCHNIKDLDTVLSIVEKKHGAGNAYEKYIKEGSVLLSNCCFLMAWGDFTKMCKFVFPVLEEFGNMCGCGTDVEKWREKVMRDFGGRRTDYQMRLMGFLAERLISAWIWCNLKWYTSKDVVIVHYNTPELTEACVKSLMKNTPDCNVIIFDNSDERPFKPSGEALGTVTVIDNTMGQLINWKRWLAKYPDKYPIDNKWASAKHCYSVQKCFELVPTGFVLMDSDILIKKDISCFWDNRFAFVARVRRNVRRFDVLTTRALPYLAYINVPLCDKFHARFFNADRMYALTKKSPGIGYDTGSWFYEDCAVRGLPFKDVNIDDYMIHLGSASWHSRGNEQEWLKENEALWK